MQKSLQKQLTQWINQNKVPLLSVLALIVLLFVRFCVLPSPVAPSAILPRQTPIQQEQKKAESKEEKKTTEYKKVLGNKSSNKVTKIVSREYDSQTGKLTKETITETKAEKQSKKDVLVDNKHTKKTADKTDTKLDYEKPPTGITAGAIVLPSGAGVTVGVTVAEIAPLTLSAQAAFLALPAQAPAVGLSLNGEIAPRLEAGIGAYIGPQTAIGYTPVPGLPVSIQPGVLIQYRF